jgi:hypothetical protein
MSKLLATRSQKVQVSMLAFAAWFVFIALSLLWTPTYRGNIDGSDNAALLVPYAVVALVGAFAIVRQSDAVSEALTGTVPVLALLVTAAIAGVLVNDASRDERGEPILLYYGVTLWASWAVLVFGTALAFRTRWSTIAGVGLSLVVAVLGLFLVNARVD